MERLKDSLKYVLYVFVALLFFAACAPIPYAYSVDVKRESKIGSELGLFKSDIMIGAVIGDTTAVADSIFITYIAKGMADKLESNIDLEPSSIPVIMISRDMFDVNSLYWRLYLMESEQKNAFIILDSLEVGQIFYNVSDAPTTIQDVAMDIESSVKINIYNNITDKPLYSHRDTMVLRINIPTPRQKEILEDKSKLAVYVLNAFSSYGEKLAEKLTFAWKSERRIIYVDGRNREWYSAYSFMNDFEFDKAINVWLKFISSKSSTKFKAIAAYNIAVACELTENYELALEWLDYSDKTYRVNEANDIRRRIEAKIKK